MTTPEELGAALTKAGTARLDAALKQLRFDRPCQTHFREELITAIRKFAVMTGDLELEAGCDARMARFGEEPQICGDVLLDLKPTTESVVPSDKGQKRAAFEEWAKGDDVPHMRLHWTGSSYDDEQSQAAWMAWQASAASVVRAPDEVGALAGLADYLRLMAHSQSAPETLRRWAGEVDRVAGFMNAPVARG